MFLSLIWISSYQVGSFRVQIYSSQFFPGRFLNTTRYLWIFGLVSARCFRASSGSDFWILIKCPCLVQSLQKCSLNLYYSFYIKWIFIILFIVLLKIFYLKHKEITCYCPWYHLIDCARWYIRFSSKWCKFCWKDDWICNIPWVSVLVKTILANCFLKLDQEKTNWNREFWKRQPIVVVVTLFSCVTHKTLSIKNIRHICKPTSFACVIWWNVFLKSVVT